jgi:hypothetical protein
MAYVLRLQSLRDVEAVLGVPRSTFSDANVNRSAGFFEGVCRIMFRELQGTTKSSKIRRAIRETLAIDSTECNADGRLARDPSWQKIRANGRKSSLKLHVVWNVGKQWIEDFRVSPGRKSDAPFARQFEIRSGTTYVFDRAYSDLELWQKIIEKNAHFVSRLKSNSVPKDPVRAKRVSSCQTGVLWEGIWRPSWVMFYVHKKLPRDFHFRVVTYRDPVTKQTFDFISSNSRISAENVAALYKKRWAVELLFRWLKGNLGVRQLAVRNANAAKIQLALAVLVQLLLQLLRVKTRTTLTASQCLRQIRADLMLHGLSRTRAEPTHRTSVSYAS